MPVMCPRCNLMFGTRNELDWHVREEHTRSRPPVRTPPAADVTTPADATAPVIVGATRAGPEGPPVAPDPSEAATAGTTSAGLLGWLRRLLRPAGTNR